MTGPASRVVELGTGLRYHLLEWGDRDRAARCVLLLHGFLDSSWGWAPMMRAGLGDGVFAVAPDMRGHGDSDRVGAGGYYHFADYLADVDALLAHLPDAPLAIVGHSMGGAIAGYFAGVFPDRVERLAVLEGMGPPILPIGHPSRLKTWIAGWRKARDRSPRIYPDVDAAAERLRALDKRLDVDTARELAERQTREIDQGLGGGRAFKHDPLHLTTSPYPFSLELAAQLWRNIRCPVLAVEGAESEMTLPADELERRYAFIADLRREVVAGAGHMLLRHQPEALAARLREFLAG